MARFKLNEHGGGARGIRGCPCELCVEQNRAWRKENHAKNADKRSAYNKRYAEEHSEKFAARNARMREERRKAREAEGGTRKTYKPNARVPHGGGLTGRARCPCELCTARKKQYNRSRRAENPDYGKVDHACTACGKNYFGLPRTKHPECRSTGYRTARPGVFYLLYNEALMEFKGGICNKGSNRMQEFRTHGFLPIVIFEAEDGRLPKSVESDFHRHCRYLTLDNPYDAQTCPGGKRGYTEIYGLISSQSDAQYTIDYFEEFANKLIRELYTEESR